MAATHETAYLRPKPSDDEIVRLTSEYFDAQGSSYDDFERSTEKRRLFTATVNRLAAKGLAALRKPSAVLSVACGTGRRELEIAAMLKQPISYTGVELSLEMCQAASRRGIRAVCGSWLDVELEPNSRFDAALVLSAFGHVPSREKRAAFLSKTADVLKQDAPLFLDVLNLRDENEWGPELSKTYDAEKLSAAGFERGDVMYRKIGHPEICYYHYFTIDELADLCGQAGFSIANVWYIGYGARYGELLEDDHSGAILIEAKRN